MYACTYVYTYIIIIYDMYINLYIYIYGQASGVPSPPPPRLQWYGLVRGGGAGVCGEGWGPLELQLEKRPGVTDKAGIVRKPYASHKSYNIAQ